jgi:hypothetical protein
MRDFDGPRRTRLLLGYGAVRPACVEAAARLEEE